MTSISRLGGWAAATAAACYVFGFAVLIGALNPGDTSAWSPSDKLAFVMQHQGWYQAWFIVTYQLCGIALVALAWASHQRLQALAPRWLAIATAFALIWSGLVIASGMLGSFGLEATARLQMRAPELALPVAATLGIVQEALGGSIEVVGGIWTLLLSYAFLIAEHKRWLAIIGLPTGLAGLLTLLPPLRELAALFGLGQILWFSLLAWTLWRGDPAPVNTRNSSAETLPVQP